MERFDKIRTAGAPNPLVLDSVFLWRPVRGSFEILARSQPSGNKIAARLIGEKISFEEEKHFFPSVAPAGCSDKFYNAAPATTGLSINYREPVLSFDIGSVS